MPYITEERRKELDQAIDRLSERLKTLESPESMGDYNYAITRLIHNAIKKDGRRYQHMNNIVGMLECCKAEFIRVVVSPYEDEKIKENGPVSELDKK